MHDLHGSSVMPRTRVHASASGTPTARVIPMPRSISRGAAAHDLDVIIPAYNEESRIRSTLESLCAQMARAPFRSRVIVVDNGSVDATAEAVDRAIQHGIDVTVISCLRKGKGAAVAAGVAHARAEYLAYLDADESTPPGALFTGMAILQSGWDAVLGSRRAFGAEYVVAQPLHRRMGSRLFNAATTRIVGPVSDTQCGMKMFRTEAVQGIFRAVQLEGFAFDVEVLARVTGAGLRVMEMPVQWSDSSGSTFRPVRDGITAFHGLYKVNRLQKEIARSAR